MRSAIFGLIFISAASLGARACAQEVDVPPAWITQPSPEGRTVFADFLGLPGRVDFVCTVTVGGRLESCEATATPAGIGYERVALDSIGSALLSPARRNGEAVSASISFPMTFPAAEPWPDNSGPEPSEDMVARIRATLPPNMREGVADACIVADVAEDRRAVVQAWVDELLPCDEDAMLDMLARRVGRVILSRQQRGLSPDELRRPPSFEEFNSADRLEPAQVAAAEELRRRYCAAYDCTVPQGMGGAITTSD